MEQQIKKAGDGSSGNTFDSCMAQTDTASPLKLPTKEELGRATDAIASRLLQTEPKFSELSIEDKLVYLERRHRYLQEQQQQLLASLTILENHFHSPTGEVAVSLGELRFRMRQQRERKN